MQKLIVLGHNVVTAYNKAKQHQSRCSLDSLAVARFVHGFAIFAQNNHQQVCRCLRRYVPDHGGSAIVQRGKN